MSKPSPFKEINGVMYRKCIKCQEYKIFNEFSKDRCGAFGIQCNCKVCVKEYREQNKEKLKEYSKEYREQNKDKIGEYREQNKEKLKEYSKEYHEKNKERNNNRRKQYRDNIKNKYGVCETTLKRRKDENYRLQCNLRISNYRNLKRALEYYNSGKSDKLPAKSPSKMLLRLYEIQNHNCPYCSNNMKDDIHIDHIIPLSKSGSNEVHNLILCCSSCNLRKNAKELDVWLNECNIDYGEFMADIDNRNKMYFSE